jgi:hypothetical protein
VFLWKIYRKKLQNSCQLAAPKNLRRNFFCFTGNICLFEISCIYRKHDFSLFLLMVGLSPGSIIKILRSCHLFIGWRLLRLLFKRIKGINVLTLKELSLSLGCWNILVVQGDIKISNSNGHESHWIDKHPYSLSYSSKLFF